MAVCGDPACGGRQADACSVLPVCGLVKLIAWDVLVDDGFSASAEFRIVESHIRQAIDRVKWPPGSDVFTVYPESGKKSGMGNGVKPIKIEFVGHLRANGWILERDRFDAHYTFDSGPALPFVVEWETGNVSSSHRSINRMALGMVDGEISGGVLVLPAKSLADFLTDRIGNAEELVKFHPLWRLWSAQRGFRYLAIATVKHDAQSLDVPRIPKATDGRARG